jgi:hypothetical protein
VQDRRIGWAGAAIDAVGPGLDDVADQAIGVGVDDVAEQRQGGLGPVRRRPAVGAAGADRDGDRGAAQGQPDRGPPGLGDRGRVAVVDRDRERAAARSREGHHAIGPRAQRGVIVLAAAHHRGRDLEPSPE